MKSPLSKLPRKLSKAASKRALKRIQAAVAKSGSRMNNLTPEQRAELERAGRARIAAGSGPLVRRCFHKHRNGQWSWNAIVFQNAPISPELAARGHMELACCRIKPRSDGVAHDTKAEAEADMNRVLKVLGLDKAGSPKDSR